MALQWSRVQTRLEKLLMGVALPTPALPIGFANWNGSVENFTEMPKYLCYVSLGLFNVPKVLRYSSTVIFPIAYTTKASPNEKISKKFQIYYGSKRIIVLLYRVILAILVNHKLLKKSMKEMNQPPNFFWKDLLGSPGLP